MKYKDWDFLSCECKDNHKYCVIWRGEENWYEFYILRNIEKRSNETLLVDFVDKQFKKINMFFLKRLYLYFILLLFNTWKQ